MGLKDAVHKALCMVQPPTGYELMGKDSSVIAVWIQRRAVFGAWVLRKQLEAWLWCAIWTWFEL